MTGPEAVLLAAGVLAALVVARLEARRYRRVRQASVLLQKRPGDVKASRARHETKGVSNANPDYPETGRAA